MTDSQIKKVNILGVLLLAVWLATALLFMVKRPALVANGNNNLAVNKASAQSLIKTERRADPLITPASELYASIVRPNDIIRGKKTAKVLIIEFGDYECTECRELDKNLIKILAEYPQQVKLVWKDFIAPVHLAGRQAALAARCAGEQGKFWPFHDRLFENDSKLSEALYFQIAKNLNLDMQQFNSCLKQRKEIKALGQGLQDGQALGVDRVPYLFIGNHQYGSVADFKKLKAAVEAEL